MSSPVPSMQSPRRPHGAAFPHHGALMPGVIRPASGLPPGTMPTPDAAVALAALLGLYVAVPAGAQGPYGGAGTIEWVQGVSAGWAETAQWQENRVPCPDEVADLPMLSSDYLVTVSTDVGSCRYAPSTACPPFLPPPTLA